MRVIAMQFLSLHRLTLPLDADVAAFAAGLFLVPSYGPASLTGNVLRYDESRPAWAREVWSLVCGRILEHGGHRNEHATRAELAHWLGADLSIPTGPREPPQTRPVP